MMRRGRDLEAKQRMQERWRRQDESKRLKQAVAGIEDLRIVIDQRDEGDELPSVSHIRVVPVESAPALFEIPCPSKDCCGGVYDMTDAVMSALQSGVTRFEGSCACNGSTANHEPCRRTIRYTVYARYRGGGVDAAGASRSANPGGESGGPGGKPAKRQTVIAPLP
jgi:hypothetical protein